MLYNEAEMRTMRDVLWATASFTLLPAIPLYLVFWDANLLVGWGCGVVWAVIALRATRRFGLLG